MIKIKRAYEEPSNEDGFRILVDQLWPRGLTKERAGIHLWMKEIAPSTALRRWFSHDPSKWKEFHRKYLVELKGKKTLVDELRKVAREQKVVTLVFAAKDEEHNNAIVLEEFLEEK